MLRILILALLVSSPAMAGIYAAADFSGDGYHSSSSEGPNAKLYSSTTGPVEYSQVFDLTEGRYRTWAGLNGSGDFSASTPEYNINIREAKDLYVTAALNRNTKLAAVEEEMEAEFSRVKLTQTLAHTSTVDITARGNGRLSEDIRIGSSTAKNGLLHLWDFDMTGNFSMNRTLRLDGNESRERFEALPEVEEEEIRRNQG